MARTWKALAVALVVVIVLVAGALVLRDGAVPPAPPEEPLPAAVPAEPTVTPTEPATTLPAGDGATPERSTAPATTAVDPAPEASGRPLGPPSVVGDGTAVFDLRLRDGERFRLSLPVALGTDLIVHEPPGAPVVVTGPAATLSISFGWCEDQPRAINRLGAWIRMADELIDFCRPDELIVVAVEPVTPLDPIDAEAFDLRPVELGARYGAVLTQAWPELGNCSNCAPWGPMAHDGVVVNQTGPTAITAVRVDTLEEVWTVDPGGHGTYLHGGPDGIYVEVTGGPFLRLDPLTGEERWRVTRDPDERDAGLSGHADGVWLLRSSFHVEGDDRPPVLRRLDIDTGAVPWSATGRAGAEWQWDRPLVVGGIAMLLDVTNHPQLPADPVGTTLRGYDVVTGDLAWAADLASPTEAYDHGLLVAFDLEDGPAVLVRTIDGDIVRVDPATGELLWRTAVAGGRFGGTDFAPDGSLAIDLITAAGRVLLDPATGAPLPAADG